MDAVSLKLARNYTNEKLNNLPSNAPTKTVSFDGGIYSVGSDVVNGQISVTLKGNTYTNFIKNGNFANGINNWATQSSSSVLSASNNTLIVTGTGNISTVSCIQNFNINILQAGHKYYVRAMVRVTNSECTNIKLTFRSSLSLDVASQPSPVQNQWYTLSGIITALGTFHTPYIRVMCIYPDAATAAGKVTEVQEVIAIDLTVHGLDSLTVDQCNQRFAHWFDGTKSTLNARLVSVGKNLFDKNKIITGYVISTTGSLYPLENYAVTPFIKVTPNTQYYYNQGYSSGTTRRAYYTSNKELISTESPERGVFLTPPNTSYVRTSLKLDVINIDTYQIEPGTTATEYEPYKESIAYVIAKDKEGNILELRSLPNGVKDEFNVVMGEYIQRIGKHILQESDFTEYRTSYDNIDIVWIKKPLDSYMYGKTSNVFGTAKLFDDRFQEINRTFNDSIDLENTITFFAATDRFAICVPKGTYADLATARADLAGKTLIYQLAEPIITKLPAQAPLQVFENGTVYVEPIGDPSETTVPSVEMTIPIGTSNKFGVATHDYGGAAADWELTNSESKCFLLAVSNAGGAANIIAPDAPGVMYAISNASGYAITIKKSGGTGVAVTNAKTVLVIHNGTDYTALTAEL